MYKFIINGAGATGSVYVPAELYVKSSSPRSSAAADLEWPASLNYDVTRTFAGDHVTGEVVAFAWQTVYAKYPDNPVIAYQGERCQLYVYDPGLPVCFGVHWVKFFKEVCRETS